MHTHLRIFTGFSAAALGALATGCAVDAPWPADLAREQTQEHRIAPTQLCAERIPKNGDEPEAHCSNRNPADAPWSTADKRFHGALDEHSRCYHTCNASEQQCNRDLELALTAACTQGRHTQGSASARCLREAETLLRRMSRKKQTAYIKAQLESCSCCDPGQVRCDDECTDTSSDPLHCGSCDTACGTGTTCIEGKCEVIVTDLGCSPHDDTTDPNKPTVIVAQECESVFLSDICPLAEYNIHKCVTFDTTYWDPVLHLDDQTYEKGVSTHAPDPVEDPIECRFAESTPLPLPSGVGRVTWDVSKFASFSAVLGLQSSLDPEPPLDLGDTIFRVYLDDELAFEQEFLYSTPPLPLTLDLEGAKVLALEVDSEGFNNSDHSVWFDARLKTYCPGASP